MRNYDIVLYFGLVHGSHIHKYLALNKRLNQHCNSLMILNCGRLGIKKNVIDLFHKEDLFNVEVLDENSTEKLFSELGCKIYLFGSAGAKYESQSPGLINSRNKGSLIMMLSVYMGDLYITNVDIIGLICPFLKEMNPKLQGKKIIYSNGFLWDNIEECLPYQLSKSEFCKKYKLDACKDIFVWTPDNIRYQRHHAAKVYTEVCKLKNLIISLHPTEYKYLYGNKYRGKLSAEIFAPNVPLLNPLDTHWCYKYVDCGIGYTSTVGLEFAFYRKPFLYVDFEKLSSRYFNKYYNKQYSWAGKSCELGDLSRFISNKEYIVEDDVYTKHLAKYCADPNKKGIDLLSEQIKEILGEIK